MTKFMSDSWSLRLTLQERKYTNPECERMGMRSWNWLLQINPLATQADVGSEQKLFDQAHTLLNFILVIPLRMIM